MQKLRQFSVEAVDSPPPYTKRARSPRSLCSPLVPGDRALRSLEMLSSLTEEQLRRLAQKVDLLYFEPHEVIERLDTPASHFYYLVEVCATLPLPATPKPSVSVNVHPRGAGLTLLPRSQGTVKLTRVSWAIGPSGRERVLPRPERQESRTLAATAHWGEDRLRRALGSAADTALVTEISVAQTKVSVLRLCVKVSCRCADAPALRTPHSNVSGAAHRAQKRGLHGASITGVPPFDCRHSVRFFRLTARTSPIWRQCSRTTPPTAIASALLSSRPTGFARRRARRRKAMFYEVESASYTTRRGNIPWRGDTATIPCRHGRCEQRQARGTRSHGHGRLD